MVVYRVIGRVSYIMPLPQFSNGGIMSVRASFKFVNVTLSKPFGLEKFTKLLYMLVHREFTFEPMAFSSISSYWESAGITLSTTPLSSTR